jgi:hypothetical protein
MNLVLQSAVTGPARSRHLRIRPLLAALLSAGILLPASMALAADGDAGRSAPAKTYAIASAPLADVLNRYAAEAGVVLVFDAGVLGGAQSKGLQGKYDVQGGFQALLAGTRYDAVMNKSGGFVLRERPPAAAAARGEKTAQADAAAEPTLQPIHVQASTLGTVEKLDREMISNAAAINGDLTSMLRLNPNVQYDEALLSSATGGEISPAEISIHGAKAYQNEILLDGVSISNDIDPGNKITTTSPDLIPGSAQSLAVDASILCEIEVLDSNVSAEYGRFVGGVVKSRICSARKQFGGKVAVGYTSSSWSKLLIDPAREQEFEESSNADLQPRFKKWTYKTTAEARIGADWGVLVSGVRRTSDIPLKRFDTSNEGTTVSREVTQKRKQDTLIVKTDYTPAAGIHKGELTLAYAPSANTYFIENFRDSDYTIESGGINLSGRLESRFDLANVTNQLSWSRNEQSRRGDADTYMNWRWSADKNWGDPADGLNPMSGEGAQGDVDQEIKSFEYKLRAAFTPFKTGPVAHRVGAGLELRSQEATYARLKTQYNYTTNAQLPATGAMSRCQAPDGTIDTVACSSAFTRLNVGQFFRNLIIYNQGSLEVKAHSLAAYLEDEASWGTVSLRAGVRADKDSLASKTNIAPRLKLSWQASEALSFDAGANRYYGRNLFAYALQEKVNLLKTTRMRPTTSLVWGAEASSKPLNRLDDVRSPHDNELTAGLTYESDLLAGPLSVRFTHRDGKDQIVRLLQTRQAECNASQCYVFTNNGSSETKDLTVSWSNARAFKLGGTVNRMWVAANKSDTKSNYSTYADNYSSAMLTDELISYNGTVLRYSQIPANNYNRPWTLRIGAMTTLPARHLTVNNMLRVRGSYDTSARNGTVNYEGSDIMNFERTTLPTSLAIDTVVHWSPRIYKRQELDVKLTIENLTNRKNKMTVSEAYVSYERGRTIALEIGYDF